MVDMQEMNKIYLKLTYLIIILSYVQVLVFYVFKKQKLLMCVCYIKRSFILTRQFFLF